MTVVTKCIRQSRHHLHAPVYQHSLWDGMPFSEYCPNEVHSDTDALRLPLWSFRAKTAVLARRRSHGCWGRGGGQTAMLGAVPHARRTAVVVLLHALHRYFETSPSSFVLSLDMAPRMVKKHLLLHVPPHDHQVVVSSKNATKLSRQTLTSGRSDIPYLGERQNQQEPCLRHTWYKI